MEQPMPHAERDALLQSIEAGLRRDERVVGAWLAGSIGRGQADDLSDIDLWLLIRDEDVATIAKDPVVFVHGIVHAILNVGASSNAPTGGAYLLTWIAGKQGPQQVDWYWPPAKDARRPSRSVLLFERAAVPIEDVSETLVGESLKRAIDASIGDVLVMTFIAAKHVRRSDPWRTARHLEHVDRCLGNLRWLLETQSVPAFGDPVQRSLPQRLPMSTSEQVGLLRGLSTTFAKLLARSDREGHFVTARASLQSCLDLRGP